jgi:hypothetical protein
MLAAETVLTVALRRLLATSKPVQAQLGSRFAQDLVRLGDPNDALRCQSEQQPATPGLPTEPLVLHVSRSLLQLRSSGSNSDSGRISNSNSHISSSAAGAATNTAIGGDPLQELPRVAIDYHSVHHAVNTASAAYGELQQLLTSCDCAPCRCSQYVPTTYRPDVCQCTHPATHHQLRLPDASSSSSSSPALLQADAAVSALLLALGIWGLF